MSECPICGAGIEWLRTPLGRLMPVSLEPDPKGTIVKLGGGLCRELKEGETGRLRIEVDTFQHHVGSNCRPKKPQVWTHRAHRRKGEE